MLPWSTYFSPLLLKFISLLLLLHLTIFWEQGQTHVASSWETPDLNVRQTFNINYNADVCHDSTDSTAANHCESQWEPCNYASSPWHKTLIFLVMSINKLWHDWYCLIYCQLVTCVALDTTEHLRGFLALWEYTAIQTNMLPMYVFIILSNLLTLLLPSAKL